MCPRPPKPWRSSHAFSNQVAACWTTPNYLSTMGVYRAYMRLTGRRYTETGQPINNFVWLPLTLWWMRLAGLHIQKVDAQGHYLPFPRREAHQDRVSRKTEGAHEMGRSAFFRGGGEATRVIVSEPNHAPELGMVVEMHPSVWELHGCGRPDAEALLQELGLQALALTG